jgi:hypothetical protein
MLSTRECSARLPRSLDCETDELLEKLDATFQLQQQCCDRRLFPVDRL